jgi:uncharacterized protein DUF3558
MGRWVSAVIGVAAVIVLAGCSEAEIGQPTPVSSSSDSTRPSVTDTNGSVGRVRTPLNDARLVSDPCSALTTSQLQEIGFTTAVKTHVERLGVANVCDWNDNTIGNLGASAGVAVQTTLTHGLSDIYAQRSEMAYFTPVMIEGYPAVFADFSDRRNSGTCALNLGVSDTSVLAIDYDQDDLGSTSCDKTQAIARAVVESLRGT